MMARNFWFWVGVFALAHAVAERYICDFLPFLFDLSGRRPFIYLASRQAR